MRVCIGTNSKGYLGEGRTNGQSNYYNSHDDILAKERMLFAKYSQVTATYGTENAIIQKPKSVDVVRKIALPLKVSSQLSVDLQPFVSQNLKEILDKHAFDVAIIGSLCPQLGALVAYITKSQHIPKIGIYHTFVRKYVSQYFSLLGSKSTELSEDAIIAYEKKVFGDCDLLLVPSQFVLDQLRKDGLTVPMKIHGRGIDTKKFKPGKKQHFSIHTVSRVTREKGFDKLPELASLVGLPITVCGQGSYEKQLKDCDNIFLVGEKRGCELVEVYQQNSIFIFLSTTDTYGQVIDEAMASGNVVVAFDVGGHVERIMHGKTGFLCSSVEEMSEVILTLKRDPELVSQVGKAARESVLTQTWRANLQERIALCEECIAEFRK